MLQSADRHVRKAQEVQQRKQGGPPPARATMVVERLDGGFIERSTVNVISGALSRLFKVRPHQIAQQPDHIECEVPDDAALNGCRLPAHGTLPALKITVEHVQERRLDTGLAETLHKEMQRMAAVPEPTAEQEVQAKHLGVPAVAVAEADELRRKARTQSKAKAAEKQGAGKKQKTKKTGVLASPSDSEDADAPQPGAQAPDDAGLEPRVPPPTFQGAWRDEDNSPAQ